MITININTNGKITLTTHTTPKEKQKYPLQFQTAYELKQKRETLPWKHGNSTTKTNYSPPLKTWKNLTTI